MLSAPLTKQVLLGLRIAQALLSVIVLGLAAAFIAKNNQSFYYYGTYYRSVSFPGLNYAIFLCIFTWLCLVYLVLASLGRFLPKPQVTGHVVAVLVVDGVLTVFWLACWADAAALAAYWDYSNGLSGGVAGVGAIIWLTFIAALVFDGIALHQWRIGRSTAAAAAPATAMTATAPAAVPVTEEPKVASASVAPTSAPAAAATPYPHDGQPGLEAVPAQTPGPHNV